MQRSYQYGIIKERKCYFLTKVVLAMKWEDVRKTYPNRFVKLQVLKSHVAGNKRIIEDMAVVEVFEDNKQATKELSKATGDLLVYHTGNAKIELEIKQIFGYRGIQV